MLWNVRTIRRQKNLRKQQNGTAKQDSHIRRTTRSMSVSIDSLQEVLISSQVSCTFHSFPRNRNGSSLASWHRPWTIASTLQRHPRRHARDEKNLGILADGGGEEQNCVRRKMVRLKVVLVDEGPEEITYWEAKTALEVSYEDDPFTIFHHR